MSENGQGQCAIEVWTGPGVGQVQVKTHLQNESGPWEPTIQVLLIALRLAVAKSLEGVEAKPRIVIERRLPGELR